MKLFKKVLAAALAGVLALSVLTGCNNSNSVATVKMLDELNDWSRFYGEGITFEKGDEKLQAQVNDLVEIVDDAGKKINFQGGEDIDEMYWAIVNDGAAKLKLKDWAKQFSKATIDDENSPLYEFGFVDISTTLSASSSQNIYYALQLMENRLDDEINPPATVKDSERNRNWTDGDKFYVAVATGEINGKKYMVALFKTTAVTNPEYNPNDGGMGEDGSED